MLKVKVQQLVVIIVMLKVLEILLAVFQVMLKVVYHLKVKTQMNTQHLL